MRRFDCFIDGAWRPPTTGEYLPVENPASGALVGEAAAAGPVDVDQAVAAARRAFRDEDWARNPRARAAILQELGRRVAEVQEEVAALLTEENGRPIRETRAELLGVRDGFSFYAGLCRVLYGRAAEFVPNVFGVMLNEPIGVVGIIVPWNWPLTLLVRSLAPALAAGNTVVIKPASATPLSTCLLIERLQDCLPRGVVNVVTGRGQEVGRALVEHPDVDMIAFTGDSETGKDVMRRAAETVKKLTLELGGKSANIVLADADLDRAVAGAVNAAYVSAGQICTAGSRLLLEEGIAEPFLERLAERVSRLRLGPGNAADTDIGPLVSAEQRERVLRHIELGRREARLLVGGTVPEEAELQRGYFVRPTVFIDVPPHSPLAQEEIFGPVLAVLTFRTEEEAVALANDCRYGLAAGVWGRDLTRVLHVARGLQAGTVWVNTYHQFYNEAEVGGYKESGLGRQQGLKALEEFSEWKHINLDTRPSFVASR